MRGFLHQRIVQTRTRSTPLESRILRMRKITLKHSLPARLAKHFDEDLNDSQRAAVSAPDGYNLILAGPGSGKTRVITYRVAHLIARGVPAESILLVTFTRRAAREMVHRLDTLIGRDAAKVWAGTFHHVGNRVLRRPAKLLGYEPNFTILDSEDQLDLVRLAMDDEGLARPGQRQEQSKTEREGQARAQGGPDPPPAQLQRQHPGAAGEHRSPGSLPSLSTGCPGSRRSARPTPGGSLPPTAWIMTIC